MTAMKSGVIVISKSRSLLALALILWCGGAGCLAVSYARGAAMIASSDQTLGNTSHSMKAHACCKAHLSKVSDGQTNSGRETNGFREASLPATPSEAEATSCCPLTSGSFVATSVPETNTEDSAIINQSELFLIRNTRPVGPPVLGRRLADQNQTYLRGCAFLI